MKKAVRIISITCGGLLLGNTALMMTIANLNFGLLPVALLGTALLVYGLFFEKLPFRRCISGVLAFGLSVIIAFTSFLALYGRLDNATYNEKTVIVLGCGIRGERVSVGLAKRLNKAYEYHLQNPDAVIIVSGGQGPQEDISEALAMKRYLMEKGVPEDRIIMEDKSTSTITNFKYSHEIMKEKGLPDDSVVFVTNGYHVYRGASYAKAEGLTVTHLGTDIIWYTIPMNYLREMLAVLKMWVFD